MRQMKNPAAWVADRVPGVTCEPAVTPEDNKPAPALQRALRSINQGARP